MKKTSRLSYAYAVGRIRVLERSLISSAVLREAAEEKDVSSALKVIFDAGQYEEEMVNIDNSEDLDGFLEKEQDKLNVLIRELLLEEDIYAILSREFPPENVLTFVERSGYAFIRDYLRHKIDLGNIKIFLRSKYLDLPAEKYRTLVLKGGFLDRSIFIKGYEMSFSEFGQRIQASDYRDLWNRATDELEENETFVLLERCIEDFLMNFLQKAKFIVFGPEPVFSYVLAKKRELDLVRLVGLGKMCMMPIPLIKNRISETYV